MLLSSNHPVIALWLITELILQPQIAAADVTLRATVACISRPCKIRSLIRCYIVKITVTNPAQWCHCLQIFFFHLSKQTLLKTVTCGFLFFLSLRIKLPIWEMHLIDNALHASNKSELNLDWGFKRFFWWMFWKSQIPSDAVRLIWRIQITDSDQTSAFASVPAPGDQRKTARRKINKNTLRPGMYV